MCHVWLGVSSMEVKTESDADCMILECPHDDKWPTVGMLLYSFICFWSDISSHLLHIMLV